LGPLLAALCLCIGFALSIWYQVNANKISINISPDLFLVDEPLAVVKKKEKKKEEVVLTDNKKTSITGVITPTSRVTKTPITGVITPTNRVTKIPLTGVITPTNRVTKIPLTGVITPTNIVTKTAQTIAVGKAVSYIKNGDNQAAKSILGKTPKVFQDEVKLRLMIKENPSFVFPYIKKNYLDYKFQIKLLAMAAQAEQRANNHSSAIALYKRLIAQQPKDARWRAGVAISLEMIGEIKAAKNMYLLAMNMPNLPLALKKFSAQRLTILR
jgi:tetratricopeptide (TPR) repeat protein